MDGFVARRRTCCPIRSLSGASIDLSPMYQTKCVWLDRLVIVTRSCMVIFDIFVMSVLWYKCREVWRTSQIARQQHSLTQHLLKDGTLLFLFLLVINILHVILWLTIDFQWTTTLFLQPILVPLYVAAYSIARSDEPPTTTADLDTIDIDVLFAHSTSEDLEHWWQVSAEVRPQHLWNVWSYLAMNSQERE
ncbi:uncharacterized protein B0H18DRAFT_281858 [Fomitopsis serialis]|uniref:uncharacterized protein n=1 Tax=Fomitopsis serialis TaxID=139415 RepID=UPI002007BAC1|nr:uncharacterized protein B0H18DRAFT_281858 [Neoantrodia serialis]KAH9927630.1 hypothetical protein B0H18DRAFT_281858 [Neoantrodia serialis]